MKREWFANDQFLRETAKEAVEDAVFRGDWAAASAVIKVISADYCESLEREVAYLRKRFEELKYYHEKSKGDMARTNFNYIVATSSLEGADRIRDERESGEL